MYIPTRSQLPSAPLSTPLATLLATLEAGPPACSCPPARDHRCRGSCAPDDPCDCCEGDCECPIPRDHACRGDCKRLDDTGHALSARWNCLCCRGICDCPAMPWLRLCQHTRAWLVNVEAVWPVLLLLLPRPAHRRRCRGQLPDAASDPFYFDAYADLPPPTDVILSQDTTTRVEMMRARLGRGEGVFERKQLHIPAFEMLAVQAHDRGRNGNDVTTGQIGLEKAVRRG